MRPLTLEQLKKKLYENDPTFKAIELLNIESNSTWSEFGHHFCHLTENDLKELAEAIKANTTVTTLHIIQDGIYISRLSGIKGKGLWMIVNAFKNNSNLKSIKLYINLWQEYLIDFLDISAFNHIEELDIHLSWPTGNLLRKIGKKIRNNYSIKELSISASLQTNYEIGIGSLKIFFQGFANKKFKKLELTNFSMNKAWQGYLASYLEQNKSLHSLAIKNCKTSSGMMPYIKQILSHNKLSSLNLSKSDLSTDDLNELIKCMTLLSGLKYFSIANNDVEPALTAKLINACQENLPNLETFVLAGESCEKNIVYAIKELILNQKNLKNLILNEFKIFKLDDFANLLSDATKCQLKEFHFKSNVYDTRVTYQKLIEILDKNKYLRVIKPGTDVSGSLINKMLEKKQLDLLSQQAAIDDAVKLSNIFSSLPFLTARKTYFPVDLFLLILSYCKKEILGMTEADYQQCCQLIFLNFCRRRKLYSENKYQPGPDAKADISSWWSCTNSNGVRLFKATTDIASLKVANPDNEYCYNHLQILKKPWS